MDIDFEMEQLPFCCGFYEVGNMSVADEEDRNPRWGEIYTKELEKVIPDALENANGRPVVFNFVREREKERKWDEDPNNHVATVPLNKRYNCAELHQVVKKYPGRKHIGTWINPGTGNQIDSYVIFPEKE